jgi:hypothetical protein
MRTLAILAAGTFLVGCAGDQTFVQPPEGKPSEGARWAQYCTYLAARDRVEVNRFLAQQGARGWELASAGEDTATTYCFKMRLAPRGATGQDPQSQ